MLNEREFWQLFASTGDPLAYVFYKGARAEQTEESKEREECSSIPASTVS